MPIQSTNPATGETFARFDALPASAIEQRLAAASAAFSDYRATPMATRAAWLLRLAAVLQDRRDELAALAVSEMGKTRRSALAELDKCVACCRYYAEHAAVLLADETLPADPGTGAFVRYLPLGPVLAVMPWNFPFWQVIRFAAPALMAGNVALLKHASNVPQCALALERAALEAGFPAGVFQTLLVGADAVRGLIADPRVAAVTLTGSEAAGVSVAQEAGRQLKKCVLELGGSDPFVVLPSADLAAAVAAAVTARNLNNGQSCIAAKRFIIHTEVYDQFLDGFIAGMRAQVVGDPMRDDTQVGPLVNEQARRDVQQLLDDSVARGARVLCGGGALPGPGFFYAPTVVVDIPEDAPLYYEEVFGPVALVFRARDARHALALANDSKYGLGSSVWTRDAAEQALFITELEAGQTFVNAIVASDPRLPFGGIKRSGYGRELGVLGLREFTNVKTALVR